VCFHTEDRPAFASEFVSQRLFIVKHFDDPQMTAQVDKIMVCQKRSAKETLQVHLFLDH
jgi:hypothetical protein